MATVFHDSFPAASQIAASVNANAVLGVGSSIHLSPSETTLTAADAAVTLATVLTLSRDIYYVYLFHLADTVAHKVADAPPALVVPVDQTTANTFLNAVKADYNTHRASTTYHYTADSTNVVTAAAATNLATSIDLANDIKAQLIAHLAAGATTQALRLTNV